MKFKSKILTLAIVLYFQHKPFCQTKTSQEARVFNAKEFVFYGYDYTHFKIADAKRLDEDLKKFVFEWIGFCSEHVTEKKLQSWLDKDKVSFDYEPTLSLNKQLKTDDLGTITKHTFPGDSIPNMVRRYITKEKEGIGLAIQMECFDNSKKRVSAYFTFFDIATKEVLMSDYLSSRDGNSYNRVSDWGSGTVIAVKKYVSVYKEKQKTYK